MTPAVYRGQRVALTTKHGKERQLATPLQMALGATVVTVPGIDTDLLGTFSGEIERVGTPLEVAKCKARLGMKQANLPFGIASEGSFGPHPVVPFASCDEEFLVFIDDTRGFFLAERALSPCTNFAGTQARTYGDLSDFLQRVGFPDHAHIVRPRAGDNVHSVTKGIQTAEDLQEAVERCRLLSADGVAQVETDMRAHMNPTRRRVIRRLAWRLARRLRDACPACGTPGWGVVDVRTGLPCAWCDAPTDLVAGVVYRCAACPHSSDGPAPNQQTSADPGHCSLCNP